MPRMRRRTFLVLSAASLAPLPAREKTLDIHFIDVEGGQATLLVGPSGESLLVDAGWPGYEGRDANRIVAAAKKAGVKRLDTMLTTHYHMDHVGGVSPLAAKLPVRQFLDHGANTETGRQAESLSSSYEQAIQTTAGAKRVTLKPGERVAMKGVEITVLTARGEALAKPAGAAANPLCAQSQRQADDPSENARSLGILVQFGKFRFLDLGDLTWNKEVDLVCPDNRIGTVDVYLSTHHGMDISNPPALVHAVRPRVVIMNNGARKGGAPAAWQVMRSAPGLEDLWQVHYAMAGGKEHNAPDPLIANLDERCEGHQLQLSARADGSFTVRNSRNKYEKTYAAR